MYCVIIKTNLFCFNPNIRQIKLITMKTFTSGVPGRMIKPVLALKKAALSFFVFSFPFLFSVSIVKAGHIDRNSSSLPYSHIKQAGNSPMTVESMRSNLYLLNADNSTILADGVLTEYNNLFHDSVTLEDARKFTNINENIGLARYGSTLAIERRPVIGTYDTLFFKLWKTTQRSYQLEFIPINLNHPGMEAFLLDSYLATSTPVDLSGTTRMNFSVNADVASAAINRFKIIYHTISSGPLPVTFTSVKANQANNKISIDWMVENEINIEKYEVEKSLNGTLFTTISKAPIASKNAAFGSYSWWDGNMENGNNFYRIKSIDRNSSIKYSPIAKVLISKNPGAISIYPNPVRGNQLNMQFTNQPMGVYQLKLINNTGQSVYSGSIHISSSNTAHTVNFNQNLKAGIYQLEIKKSDNTILSLKAVVQE